MPSASTTPASASASLAKARRPCSRWKTTARESIPTHLPRIFEAFFSTKEEVGTGIGLWVTRELVEKNGGRIYAHSSTEKSLPSGASTQFRVEFPATL